MEVLFYLVAPTFILMARGRVVPVALMVTVALMLAATGNMSSREADLWKFFCVGILASEGYDRWGLRVRPWMAALAFCAGAALIVAVYSKHDLHRQAILAVGIGLFLFGSLAWSPAARALCFRPLQMLGCISYSIFLWHGFLLAATFPLKFDGMGLIAYTGPALVLPQWFIPAVFVPAVLAIGALSFVVIERPFLLLGHRLKATEAARAAVPLAG